MFCIQKNIGASNAAVIPIFGVIVSKLLNLKHLVFLVTHKWTFCSGPQPF